ncbi:MAG: transcriptional repressor [Elusimicrobia bacterium]|nr:transcriptional repressor [Elusimicrobiota bacterium]
MRRNGLESVFEKKGLYSTRERRGTLKALADYGKPLTAKQLHERIGRGSCDLATVHRTLTHFEKAGIVRVIALDGRSRWFELKDHSGHHHHVFCTSCERIEDVPMCRIAAFTRYASEKLKFRIHSHSLELFGFCPKCQKAGKSPR